MNQVVTLFRQIKVGAAPGTGNKAVIKQFARALAQKVKAEPSVPSQLRVMTSALCLGTNIFGNQAIATLIKGWGIDEFTIKTAPKQERLERSLGALFEAVVREDVAAFKKALGDNVVFECEGLGKVEDAADSGQLRRVDQFCQLFESMIGEYTNWDLYLGIVEIELVHAVLGRKTDRSIVPDGAIAKYVDIYRRVSEKKIELFVFSPEVKGGRKGGWAMKRLVTKLVLGTRGNLGYHDVARIADKVGVVVGHGAKTFRRVSRVTFSAPRGADPEMVVLRFIKKRHFNPQSNKFKLRKRRELVDAISVAKSAEFERAVVELESLLAKLGKK